MTSRTILAVSDNPIILKEARAALESVGYAVLEAQDRRSALQMMATHAPDLILQDRLLLEQRASARARFGDTVLLLLHWRRRLPRSE